ncbi:MAG: hypothetical protein WD097_01775 [Balneolales bacterium]
MDIFKIIFEHDITIEQLPGENTPGHRDASETQAEEQIDRETRLKAYFHPEKTYNRYYFTGTRIPDQLSDSSFSSAGQRQNPESHVDGRRDIEFGLTCLSRFPETLKTLNIITGDARKWHSSDGSKTGNLLALLKNTAPFQILISGHRSDPDLRPDLRLDDHTGINELFGPLTHLLDKDHMVLITEKSHHGSDFQLFSRHNLFEKIFIEYQKMVRPEFRCFSINGKRVQNERYFYFETWTLDRPPHGFQEITPDARIR